VLLVEVVGSVEVHALSDVEVVKASTDKAPPAVLKPPEAPKVSSSAAVSNAAQAARLVKEASIITLKDLEKKLTTVGNQSVFFQKQANKILREQVVADKAYHAAQEAKDPQAMAIEKDKSKELAKKLVKADALAFNTTRKQQFQRAEYKTALEAHSGAIATDGTTSRTHASSVKAANKIRITTEIAADQAAILKKVQVDAEARKAATKLQYDRVAVELRASKMTQKIQQARQTIMNVDLEISKNTTNYKMAALALQGLKLQANLPRDKTDQEKYDQDQSGNTAKRTKARNQMIIKQKIRISLLNKLSGLLDSYKSIPTALFKPKQSLLTEADKIKVKIAEAVAEHEATKADATQEKVQAEDEQKAALKKDAEESALLAAATKAKAVANREELKGEKGEGYRGHQTETETGKTCQRWDTQSPHKHRQNMKTKPTAGLNENYCRNPDGKDTIWCYTNDKTSNWEKCKPLKAAIPEPKNEEERKEQQIAAKAKAAIDKEELKGVSDMLYRGSQTKTVSGKTCKEWRKTGSNSKTNPGAGLDGNYCRNPDKLTMKTIWCYTNDKKNPREYCKPMI